MKLKHPNLIVFLVGILITFLLINPLLWLVDPAGLLTYRQDLEYLRLHYTPTYEGYVIEDGLYKMRGYTATIIDGRRIMPTSESADCTISFVGDSVTWGHGASDEDVFAYQISQAIPGIQFVNEGQSSYNSENVWRTIERSNADGFIYTHFYNDNLVMPNPSPYPVSPSSPLARYITWYRRDIVNIYDNVAYSEAMDAIRARDDVLIVAFENDVLLNDDSVDRIPFWTSNVSIADAHPDATGHDEITASLLPIVEPFVNEICN